MKGKELEGCGLQLPIFHSYTLSSKPTADDQSEAESSDLGDFTPLKCLTDHISSPRDENQSPMFSKQARYQHFKEINESDTIHEKMYLESLKEPDIYHSKTLSLGPPKNSEISPLYDSLINDLPSQPENQSLQNKPIASVIGSDSLLDGSTSKITDDPSWDSVVIDDHESQDLIAILDQKDEIESLCLHATMQSPVIVTNDSIHDDSVWFH